jgi:hypothetical protein
MFPWQGIHNDRRTPRPGILCEVHVISNNQYVTKDSRLLVFSRTSYLLHYFVWMRLVPWYLASGKASYQLEMVAEKLEYW